MTPNTGYWMPWWAYADFLEDRGMDVGEVRELGDECEWCYPFGHRVQYAVGEFYRDDVTVCGSYCLGSERGSGFSGDQYVGHYVLTGDGESWIGNGYSWLAYD